MSRAVEISVGSLSPTINWTTLKHEPFTLPPIDQQRRIAETLWAVDKSLQACLAEGLAAENMHKAVVRDFISTHLSDQAALGDCLDEVQYGSSSKAILQPAPGLLPLLRIPNVIAGKVDFADLVWLEPAEEFEKYRLVQGDVLIVRTNGNPDYVGRTAVYEGSEFDECLFASYLIRLRPRLARLLPCFLHQMLQSESVKKEIRKHVKSSAGNYNLNTQGIRGLRIPLPPKKVQQDFLERLLSISSVVDAAARHAEANRTLSSALVNNFFNGDTP